jgi:hypothetical protein
MTIVRHGQKKKKRKKKTSSSGATRPYSSIQFVSSICPEFFYFQRQRGRTSTRQSKRRVAFNGYLLDISTITYELLEKICKNLTSVLPELQSNDFAIK